MVFMPNEEGQPIRQKDVCSALSLSVSNLNQFAVLKPDGGRWQSNLNDVDDVATGKATNTSTTSAVRVLSDENHAKNQAAFCSVKKISYIAKFWGFCGW